MYYGTFQAYAMNGDQLFGGKTARSYASMMDKARYLQKDIEVEIRLESYLFNVQNVNNTVKFSIKCWGI